MALDDTDSMMEIHNKLWRSTLTQQKHNIPTCSLSCLYLRTSVYLFNGSLFWSNNIFLNDLCHYMVFSISEFTANIYTFITHGLAQASNILKPFSHMVSSPRSYLFNLAPILCTSIIPIHQPYFSHICY